MPLKSLPVWLALLLTGCAHLVPECPAHGGETWHELTSSHFVVRTNLGPDDARAATVELERARAALLPAFLGANPADRKLEVVLLQNAAQLQSLTAEAPMEGAFTHDWRGSLMVISSDSSMFEQHPRLQVLLHALTHFYAAQSYRRLPRWLAEGLALYLETITIDAEAKNATRGTANQERLGDALRWGILPVPSLWAWDADPQDANSGLEQHRYASAWFWVHFLFNEQRPALEHFLRGLAEGQDPRTAWDTAFVHLPPRAMAEASEAFITRGATHSQRLELSGLSSELADRVLPDAEVHALFARVAAANGAWPRARREARTAMTLDAHDLRALEQHLVTQETAEARLETARALTVTEPTLASGWLLLAMALREHPESDVERGQALERAHALDPESALAASELGQRRASEGAREEAVALAAQAISLAPEDVRVLTTSASVFASAGQCGRAVTTQQRSLEVLSHRAPAALRHRLAAALQQLQQCR